MKNVLTQVPDNQASYLLACSGGVDSMTLLHFFMQSNLKFGVVHFNHGIRNDSDNDEHLVENICKEHNIPFFSKKMDVVKFCNDMKLSTELGARMLRYEFFEEIRSKNHYDILTLAHNADDVTEQVIYALSRGSSVKGLSGMKSYDETRKIYRPLINTFKDDIYKYARANNVSWNEDSTNSSSDYDRNFIRNEILPMMETRRKGVKKVIHRTAEYFSDVDDFVSSQVKEWLIVNYKNNSFDRNVFINSHKLIRGEVLKNIWNDLYQYKKNFSSHILFEVDRWLSKGEGNTSLWFGNEYKLYLKNNIVYIKMV